MFNHRPRRRLRNYNKTRVLKFWEQFGSLVLDESSEVASQASMGRDPDPAFTAPALSSSLSEAQMSTKDAGSKPGRNVKEWIAEKRAEMAHREKRIAAAGGPSVKGSLRPYRAPTRVKEAVNTEQLEAVTETEHPTSLLDLPSELRNRIYELAIYHAENNGDIAPVHVAPGCGDNTYAVIDGKVQWVIPRLEALRFIQDHNEATVEPDDRKAHICSTTCLLHPSLTRVNRQLRREVLPIFYEIHHFTLLFRRIDVKWRVYTTAELRLIKWWKDIPDEHVEMIRSLSILSCGSPSKFPSLAHRFYVQGLRFTRENTAATVKVAQSWPSSKTVSMFDVHALAGYPTLGVQSCWRPRSDLELFTPEARALSRHLVELLLRRHESVVEKALCGGDEEIAKDYDEDEEKKSMRVTKRCKYLECSHPGLPTAFSVVRDRKERKVPSKSWEEFFLQVWKTVAECG